MPLARSLRHPLPIAASRIAPSPIARRRILAGVAVSLLLGWPGLSGADDAEGPGEGIWEIEGTTRVEATGDIRQARGRVVLARDDSGYTTTFNLKTNLPTPEGSRNVDITGSGTGSLEGEVLRGTSESQWLMAAIPGLDPQFAFIPGRLGPRIISEFEMRPIPGSDDYQVDLSTVGIAGKAGEGYSPTVSSFRARRVGDKPEGRKLPLPKPHDD